MPPDLGQRRTAVQQQRVQAGALQEQVAQLGAGGQVQHGQRRQRAQRRDHQPRQVRRLAQRLPNTWSAHGDGLQFRTPA